MQKAYDRTARFFHWLGWPLLVIVLTDLVWPGDNPLWLAMVMLAMLVVAVPTLVVLIVTGVPLAIRHYRAKRES